MVVVVEYTHIRNKIRKSDDMSESNLFSDLEGLGFSTVDEDNVIRKAKTPQNSIKRKVIHNKLRSDILYAKKVVCPVCGNSFETSVVKTGRVRFIKSDRDLCPRYVGFNPILYDVTSCTNCGYTNLNNSFSKIADAQIAVVKTEIAAKYKSKKYLLNLDIKTGIERYKMALLTAMVTNANNGKRAYICLKISWLYKFWIEEIEELEELESKDKQLLENLQLQKQGFVSKAYEGFTRAYESERFPIMGMERETLEYLIAELAFELEQMQESRKWLSKLLNYKTLSRNMKDKAYDLQQDIKAYNKAQS